MVKFLLPVLGWCLLIFSNHAYAQVVLAENDQEDIIVNPNAFIFKDKSADIRDISRVIAAPDSAFIKNNSFQEVHYGFFQPSGWCKFTIQNISDHTDWVLKVHQSRV